MRQKLMLFSYKWLQSFFEKKLPNPEKLAELLTLHSFEVSEVKKNKNDFILDIDILPNRAPDCLSHLGVAREIASILNSKFKIQKSKLKIDSKSKIKDYLSLEIENKNDCSRYTALMIKRVKVKSSPKWLKEKLEVCGLNSINNVVDVVNYVMLEMGQPLHVFDFEKIEPVRFTKTDKKNQPKSALKDSVNRRLIVKRAKKGEKIISLDNEEYNLDKEILVIADEKEPLAIAGIKGGKKSEISQDTKIIILESANFNSQVIRKGSKKLNLRTEASLRFEYGLDANLTEIAIKRAAFLIQKIAGGKVIEGVLDYYPKKVLPKKIKLDLNYLESLLGIKIPEKEIKNILQRLNFKITPQPLNPSTPQLLIEVPTFRLDINLPEDLIEEIGRIYGYEKISSVLPQGALIPPKRNLELFWQKIVKDTLKEAGFTEVYNYSFISEKEGEIFGLFYVSQKGERYEIIELENPTSKEYQYLRPSLIPNLLKNIKDNLKFLKEVRIFEIGKIFFRKQKTKNREQIEEKKMLTGVITGSAFYEAKGVVDLILNRLGISNIWYDNYQPTPEESWQKIWHPQKSAEIKVNNQEIGFLGEISFKILEKLEINEKVVIFDLDFEKLTKLATEEKEYQPISKHPSAVRDLAVLVPRKVKVVEVLNKINVAGGPLVRDIDLFDIYEGEEIPEGKKSLAFHIIFQAEDRTLSSQEIEKIQNKIIKTLEKDPNWEVRK